MNLATRLKDLRRELGLSQEAFGAQGFISAPGWIKIENNQRQASEKLIAKITTWLADEKYMRAGAANTLREELLTLKYLGNRSAFMREMAATHARSLPNGDALLAPTAVTKPVRGRPRKNPTAEVALVAETPGVYKTQRKQRSVSGK